MHIAVVIKYICLKIVILYIGFLFFHSNLILFLLIKLVFSWYLNLVFIFFPMVIQYIFFTNIFLIIWSIFTVFIFEKIWLYWILFKISTSFLQRRRFILRPYFFEYVKRFNLVNTWNFIIPIFSTFFSILNTLTLIEYPIFLNLHVFVLHIL